MTINVASATAPVARPSAVAQDAGSATGGGLSIGGGASAITGALTAQPGTGANILKRVLVGGLAGAALGFGASFFTLPIVGQVAAPIAAAVGGGIGAAIGLVSGLWARHKARVAQSQQLPMATAPVQNIAPPQGKTFKVGQKGAQVKTTQKYLKKLGLYNGKITGKVDTKTAAAIRKYEIMKGAMPTGNCSPELRVALAQDIRIMAQLG